jgi:ApaG protein
MVGEYRMVDSDGRSFKVSIPAFSLDSPDGKRVLN